MKRYLLIPTLTILFALPVFSAFPGADMNNTNIEGNTTSSNMQLQYYDRNHKKHDDEIGINDRTSSNSQKVPAQHRQARASQVANSNMSGNGLESNRRHRPRQGEAGNHHSSKHHKNPRHKQQVIGQDNQKDTDSENDNLRELTRPETNNVRNNLRIPNGEDSRLNREMMLNGPQGGFQNNQPRGIGGGSY